MFFTQEDFRKIEEWLRTRTVKDTEFPHADLLSGSENVPIIQDGKNKILTINELVKQVAMMELPDFFNVTNFAKRGNLFLEQAISIVPVEQRKLGLTITFHSEKGHWLIYQFKGTSLNQWSSLNYWRSPIEEAIEELILYPDEEDITGVRDGNRTFLKFKDKDYDPADFSGMGRIILRKNLVGTEACAIDDEDHFMNILTQDMIMEENTIYIVQYDFDLNGKVISIPKGCTLWFQGGSINNGTIYLQETAILGAFEFADMGNAKLFGKFNTGQVMTFSDDSYKAKTGGYFIPTTKPSSATKEEDAKNEKETFYDKNPNAYTTQKRQELRWWNGEEWILILDITDYNEIKSIINDLIEKHNAEMSACYKYFKSRCYALELRMDKAESRIENHETRITKNETDIQNIKSEITSIHNDITDITNNINDITKTINNLGDIINNLDQIIENHIQQFIENNVVGVASVTVNGQTYTPDSNGNIELPDYPETGGGEADFTRGTLRFTGASTATFNGSEDVTVNIPEGGSGGGDTIITAKEPLTLKQGDTVLGTYDGTEAKTISIPAGGSGGQGGGIADRVANKLKFTGAVTAEYDGSEEVTVNIPAGGEGGGTSTPNMPLIFTGAVDKTYDGTKQVIVTIPSHTVVNKIHIKSNGNDFTSLTSKPSVDEHVDGKYESYDIDPTKEVGKINLTPMLWGSSAHPKPLFTALVSRSTSSSTVWKPFITYKHPFIAINISQADGAVKLTFSSAQGNNNYFTIHSAIASFSSSTVAGISKTNGGSFNSNVVGLRCAHSGNIIYVQGVRTANENNDSLDFDPAMKDGTLLGFEIVVFGDIRAAGS